MSKYCLNCKAVSDDESIKFCAACGSSEFAPVENQNTTDSETEATATQEQPAEQNQSEQPAEQNQSEQPAEQNPSEQTVTQSSDSVQIDGEFAEPSFPELPVKKKFSLKRALVFVAIPLVLIAAIILIPFTRGWALRAFGSDEAYLKFVEKNAFSEYTNGIVDFYDILLDYTSFDKSAESVTTLKIGDDTKKLLSELQISDLDLSWLNGLEFNSAVNLKDGKESADYGISIDGKEILSLSTILDFTNNDLLLLLNGLSDDALKVDMDNGGVVGSSSAASKFVLDGTLSKVVPSSKTVEKLISKYSGIVVDNIDDVSADKETVEIDGISQNLTVLEYTIDTKCGIKILKAVLKEAKNDKDIKEIIENAQKVLIENKVIDEDKDNVYEEFRDSINDVLESFDSNDSSDSNEDLVTISDYVDSKHEIVGREISSGENSIAKYMTVRKSSKFATKAEMYGITIEGSGTEKSNVIDGEFKITSQSTEVATVELKKFDSGKLGKGNISGTVCITPNMELIEDAVGGSYSAFISLLQPTLEMTFDTTSESAKVDINLKNNDKLLIGASVSTKISGGKEIKSFDDKKTVDATDTAAVKEFFNGLDYDSLVSKLRSTSIPDDYVDLIENAIKNIPTLIDSNNSRSYDDYDYESYDDYDSEDYDLDDYDFGDYDLDDYDFGDYDLDDYDLEDYDSEDYDWEY